MDSDLVDHLRRDALVTEMGSGSEADLVFKARRLVCHSPLGLIVIKKKRTHSGRRDP